MHTKTSEIRGLSDDEIEIVSGGGWFSDLVDAIGDAAGTVIDFVIGALDGPGDLRRPLDRPGQPGVPPA